MLKTRIQSTKCEVGNNVVVQFSSTVSAQLCYVYRKLFILSRAFFCLHERVNVKQQEAGVRERERKRNRRHNAEHDCRPDSNPDSCVSVLRRKQSSPHKHTFCICLRISVLLQCLYNPWHKCYLQNNTTQNRTKAPNYSTHKHWRETGSQLLVVNTLSCELISDGSNQVKGFLSSHCLPAYLGCTSDVM